MKITLYQAAEDVRELLERMDPETGELPEGFESAHELVMRKSQNVAAFILSNDREAELMETRAKEILREVAAAKKRGEWLRRYLKDTMDRLGIKSITSDDRTFKVKLERERDTSVDVFDERQLPKDYITEVPASEKPNKVLIAKALKDGFDVPGARLVRNDRLTLK